MTDLLKYAATLSTRGQAVERNVREHLDKLPTQAQRDNQIDRLIDVLEGVALSENPLHAAAIVASHAALGGVVAHVHAMFGDDPTMVLPAIVGAVHLGATDAARFQQIAVAFSGAHATLGAQGLVG